MEESSQASMIRALFLEACLRDQREGGLAAVERYRELFPGFEEVVDELYAEFGAADASRDADVVLPGTPELEHYRIEEEIGRGGQGLIYRATDRRMNRQVAIKVLKGVGRLEPGSVERFRREAALAAKIQHPGIAPVFDVGVADGVPYFVMPFVTGQSLAEWLRAAAARPHPDSRSQQEHVREVVRMLAAVATAVHAAHELGIVHRDLKPANIMITPSGVPMVMDFGLARDDSQQDLATLTASGDLIGTPAYMAPEQLRSGDGELDARADVWALGVTLYETLAMARPFEASSREALYHQILCEEPRALRQRVRGISRDLDTVVATALQKDPAHRYRSAALLAADLEAVLAGEPIAARPIGVARRLLRWTARRSGSAALVGALAAGLFVAVVLLNRGDGVATVTAAARSAADDVTRALGAFVDVLDPDEMARLDQHLREQGGGVAFAHLLPGARDVTITSWPSGARVDLRDAANQTVGEPVKTPVTVTLDEGCYYATLELAGYREVVHPFVVRRRAAAGDGEPAGSHHEVRLLSATKHDESWVPHTAGWSLLRNPVAWHHTDAFVLARQELTCGEWLEFLHSAEARKYDAALVVPRRSFPAEPQLFAHEDGKWQLAEGISAHRPVDGVSRRAIDIFVNWLNNAKVPTDADWWYHLPSELEWERAARGVDGRLYPWGNQFGAQHQGLMESNQRHGLDRSLLGVRDLVGSVRELTRAHWQGNLNRLVAKGGSGQAQDPAQLAAHQSSHPRETGEIGLGLRLVRRFVPPELRAPELPVIPFRDAFAVRHAAWRTFVDSPIRDVPGTHGESATIENGALVLVGGVGQGSLVVGGSIAVAPPTRDLTLTTHAVVDVRAPQLSPDRMFTISLRAGFTQSSRQFAQFGIRCDGRASLRVGGSKLEPVIATGTHPFGVPLILELRTTDGRVELRVWKRDEQRPDEPIIASRMVHGLGAIRDIVWQATNFVGMRVRITDVRLEYN